MAFQNPKAPSPMANLGAQIKPLWRIIVSVIAALGDKETNHFSEIHRYFNQLTNKNVRYKPFHNQWAKPEFAQLMRKVAEKVFTDRVNTRLKCQHPVLASFDKLLIQDGSSFSVHEPLKNDYPGRFTATNPAAVEWHNTYDLKKKGDRKKHTDTG